MHASRILRLTALSGLATIVAAVSHGGTATIREPAWLAAALVGAMAVAAAVAGLWRLLTGGVGAPAQTPMAILATGLIAAEAAAHWLLLAAGAQAHAGTTGGLALHTLLALAAAWLVRGLERTAAARLARRGGETTEDAASHPAAPPDRPRLRPLPSAVRGRGPPRTA